MNIGLVVCGLKGHSKKVYYETGYICCARCNSRIHDTYTQATSPNWLKTLTFIKRPPKCS